MAIMQDNFPTVFDDEPPDLDDILGECIPDTPERGESVDMTGTLLVHILGAGCDGEDGAISLPCHALAPLYCEAL